MPCSPRPSLTRKIASLIAGLFLANGWLASSTCGQTAIFPESGPYVFAFESDPAAMGWKLEKWTWDTVPETGVPAIVATGTNSQAGHVRLSSGQADDSTFGGAEYPLDPIVPAMSHRTLGFAERWLVNAAAGNAIDPGTGVYEQTNSGNATLHLEQLPAHSSIDLSFLLAVGDSFDSGNSRSLDGAFDIIVDGVTRFSHTPQSGGDGLVGATGIQTLATEANLGFAYIEQWADNRGHGPINESDRTAKSWTLDSAYDVAAAPGLTAIPHTSDSLTIEFIHRVSSAPTDEHLAIDDVRIELSSDDDGMPTSWESLHGLDPAIDDSSLDPDLDGRTNIEELQKGSNPTIGDSPFLQAGQWNVRQIRGIDEVRSLTTQDDDTGALDLLDFGLRVTGEETRTTHRFINFKEQAFQGWLFPDSEEPYPLFGEYLDGENDYVLEATGNIYARTSGEVTLGFNSNDGGVLFIDGNPVVIYNQTRQRDSSHASIFLEQGLHHVRFVTWDRDGSAGSTLFYGIDSGSLSEITPTNIALLQPFDPTAANTGDSDNDGMDDFAETHFFGNLSESANGDADNDGTLNGVELAQKTSPIAADTDGDGLTDTAEVGTHGTDPLLADTDRDGAGDGLEVNTLGANPLVVDTDLDGFSDFVEARASTSPTDATDFPGKYISPAIRSSVWQENFNQYADGTTQFPDGAILTSNKELQGVQAGALQLSSDSVKSQRTYFKLPTQAYAESGFEIRFRFKIADAEGGNPAADGFSFNYGPIRLNEWAGEEGFGKGLSVEFDTWDSSASGEPAENGYNIAVDGEDVSGGFVNASVPVDAVFHEARVAWIRTGADSGLATLEVDGSPIFTAVATPGFNPHHTYTMAFAARTAGATEDLFIDDVTVLCPGDQTDTDADGLLDLWEQHYFGNLDALADSDDDGDNLTNREELAANTHPAIADSDGDGIDDGMETTTLGTDPSKADTDGDGFSDGSEVAGIPLPTDPAKFDTDGDGYGDNFEWTQHTDPLDPKSKPNRIPVPYYSALTRTWHWRIDEVQIVWNRSAGIPIANDWLVGFVARNADESRANELEFNLRKQWDGLTYVFVAESNLVSNDGDGLWHTDWAFHDDKTRALGFSGTGRKDTSQRLSFQCEFQESSVSGSWGGTFQIINMDTGETVASHGFSGFQASDSIQNGTAQWESRRGLAGSSTIWSHAGIDVYIGGAPATEIDTDHDGMADTFEIAYGLDVNDPTDAAADLDGDGVSNLMEAQQGSRPDSKDTDGDGASDGQELLHGFSPIESASSPISLASDLPAVRDDTDENGMNDLWEANFSRGASALVADEDSDEDGQTNREESIAGTDPLDARSRFSLFSNVDGNNIRLSWPGLRHKRYEVQTSSLLDNWTRVQNVDPSADGTSAITLDEALAEDGARVFFRVNAGDLDSDADGLSDWTETQLGTDINNPDSSGSRIQSLTDETLVSGDYKTFLEAVKGTRLGAQNAEHPTRAQAARFLNQATFGATLKEIESVQKLGYEDWIDAQINDTPMYLHEPYIAELWQDHRYGLQTIPNYSRGSFGLPGENATTPFIRAATQAEDHLRQRIAFALSQILVTSLQDGALAERPQGMCNYYDIFVRNAFGNYQDILQQVSLHPVMGRYLSHIGNEKADPELNRFPDENYAREVKQLFTIGLWELNPDGTRILDEDGEPIPTYGNREITEFARVFTGLWYADRNWGSGGWDDGHFLSPMQMHPDRHDFGEKVLFEDRSLPGRPRIAIPQRPVSSENGVQDIRDAISSLFNHPNTPPFICRQLIQFLVTANPSPEYVKRVQDAFVDDGAGQRGNLAAVTRAILLDREARNPRFAMSRPTFGKLKEPLLRAMALARAFELGRHEDLVWHRTSSFYDAAYQAPLSAPSVFNFYRPDYQAPGPVRDASLVSPVFQITNSYSTISFPNFLWQTVTDGFEAQPWASERERFSLDYSSLLTLAANPPALVDHVNLLFCNGAMKVATRRKIIAAIEEVPATEPGIRAMLGAYLTLMSPEGATLR